MNPLCEVLAAARAASPRARHVALAAALTLLLLLTVRCVGAPSTLVQGETMIVAGEHVPVGTRVVTFLEPGGYDAYRLGKFFATDEPPDGKQRYSARENLPPALAEVAPTRSLTRDELRQVVHQFVLHYDAAGTSRQCFKVLHDLRNLSVHFLLDVDGTIYQTLDLREKAFHATIANNASIGVEIAHPGAFPQPLAGPMRAFYEQDEQGWRMKLPAWVRESGIRTPSFVARPARPELISGEVQGAVQHQFDFTEQQYVALAKLTAALAREFPRIRLEAPRAPDGAVLDHALPADELRAFDGVVGHLHVQRNKPDPGPAFQWERLLRDAREALGRR